jgi:hypothetical protein
MFLPGTLHLIGDHISHVTCMQFQTSKSMSSGPPDEQKAIWEENEASM